MPDIEEPTIYTNNIKMLLAAPDLNIHRSNARFVDGLSYRLFPAFESQAGPDTGAYNYHPREAYYVYRGTLRYISGMTTLTVKGYAANYGSNSHAIKVYVYNARHLPDDYGSYGDPVDTIAVVSNWTKDIALTGWTPGDFLMIDVQWDPSGYFDTMDVIDCYASPVVNTLGAWVGVPTFGSSYPAPKVNQLVQAADWLYQLACIQPIYPTLAQLYRRATHKSDSMTLWSGAVHKHFAADYWHVKATMFCQTNKERLDLILNGTVVWSSAWVGFDQTLDIDHYQSLAGYTTGAPIKAVLFANVDQGHSWGDLPIINTRYTITINGTEPLPTAPYPFAILPADFVSDGLAGQVDLTNRLNLIAGILQATYTRMLADTFTWGRMRPVRRRYFQDNKQASRMAKFYVHKFVRYGARLVVRGRGVSISWGANTLEGQEGEEFKYKFQFEQTITDGDKVQNVEVALDSLTGLGEGVTYYVTGDDVQWCGEYLS